MEEEKQTHDPEFWNDSKNAEKVMKQIRSLKSWVTKFDDCNTALEDLSVLFEFMKAGEESPEKLILRMNVLNTLRILNSKHA